MPEVYEMATEYVISILPPDFSEVCPDSRHHWELQVAWRGDGKWAVLNGVFCLGSDGCWDWEPRPSGREDGWLVTHRFSLDEALRLAREAAPSVSVNGHSATDELERYERRKALGLKAIDREECASG